LERVTQLELNQADPHAIWSEFLQLGQTSPHAQGIQLLAEAVQKIPMDDRMSVALVVTSLLAPFEWPPEWEQHRLPLVEALDSLVRAMDPAQPDSLPALLPLGPNDKSHHANGRFMLVSAAALIRSPCRRDQLRVGAGLCTLGYYSCLSVYRRVITKLAEETQAGPLLEARMKLAASLDRYAQAARALNSAVGEALFEKLDERLEMPGT
jgi:hypothetical protein